MNTNSENRACVGARLKEFCRQKLALVAKTLTTAGAFCMVGVMAVSMGQMTNEVTITFDGIPTSVSTFRQDAATILAQQQIPYDDTHEIYCRYEDGRIAEIIINSAANVTVCADGVDIPVQMHRGNVSEALERAGVELGELDLTSVSPGDPVYDGMHINVQRVEKIVTTRIVAIDHPVVKVSSSLYKVGTKKVVTKGEDGQKEVITTEIYIDGVLSSTNISEEIVQKPKTEKVMVGAKQSDAVSTMEFDDLELDENGIPLNYTGKVVGTATAYGIMDGSRTSTGMGPGVGYIAVNPKVIPYGSRLYVRTPDGKFIYGCAIAADTGPSVQQNKTVADLFLDSANEIYMFGRRQVEIYVLD